MPARLIYLLLCSVLILTAVNGCYTVFKSQTVDGKPSVEISNHEISESSVDVVFDTYDNGRWRYYLCCPWWYQSIWHDRDGFDFGVADNGMALDDNPDPAVAPPATGMGVFPPAPPAPVNSPPAGREIRYKPADSTDSSGNESNADTTKTKKPPKKPVRRGGGGK